eukprot:CAMPEP_0174712308 /NCGR_PEP_ID=MMETSP1094-20130205/13352_1 /TAXON_ID=156173 /ORGANISM="Chrysochromulina brevifilum, Strain UTEX LB 985" /LENGTH=135 /DNA_ID=CAMNT_0015911367 /DNA_START=207 /DNA_END=614 /DNA_ORIENTATION=-
MYNATNCRVLFGELCVPIVEDLEMLVVDSSQIRVGVLLKEAHHRKRFAGVAPGHHLVRSLGPIVLDPRAHVEHAALDGKQQWSPRVAPAVGQQLCRSERARAVRHCLSLGRSIAQRALMGKTLVGEEGLDRAHQY